MKAYFITVVFVVCTLIGIVGINPIKDIVHDEENKISYFFAADGTCFYMDFKGGQMKHGKCK